MTSPFRFGLCCLFKNEPIMFRRTTAGFLLKKQPAEQKSLLAALCLHNARSLLAALTYCRDHGIGCFRINSQILPLKTHPEAGYAVSDLPGGSDIIEIFKACGAFCRRHDLRTTFHPDQFIVLSSADPGIVQRSIAELVYQAEVAGWVNADVINLHGGGAYGDKKTALHRLVRVIRSLPKKVRSRLTLENDDRVYTPADLLPVCHATGVPLVYDVHHHRCLPDSLSVEDATQQALATWNREPLFHLSSPLGGWSAGKPRNHDDFIDPADIPECWRGLQITIEVEAKAKELAVCELMRQMAG
ncbi:MAG: UV DNA damage repair endonuclease UvsE [Proteobacteria bacterium]|nr:UV DNA damage repair endonuclease UvsE [Pseudomonadota bacterium]